MVSTGSLQTPQPVVHGCEDAGSIEPCERQFAAAQREMGAFVKAVVMLFGEAEAWRAAEHWLELSNSMEGPAGGYPSWRDITIAAASEVAERRCQTCESAQ
jgi:hypothetical protein